MHNLLKILKRTGCFFLTCAVFLLISCNGEILSEQQRLEKAKEYINSNELMSAAIELRNTLQKNNENAEARYLLGSLSLKIGDYVTAENEFRKAEHAGWSREKTQLALARTFIRKKQFQKLLDEIIIIDTWSATSRANISALRALAESRLGHIDQAKITLDEARTYNADAFQLLKTTFMFQASGIFDGDSSRTLEKALSLYPEDPELLLLRSINDLKNNNLSRAADTFRKIIDSQPSKWVTVSSRSAHLGLARLLLHEENYAETSRLLKRLLKQNSSDTDANHLDGLLAFKQKDYERAEARLRKLLAIAPDNSHAQQLMGQIKYALKDYNQASHHLSAYLNNEPGNITIRRLLTNTYIIQHQLERAATTLQPLLANHPDDAATLTLLSQIEFSKGDVKASIQTLRKAIESSPDNIALHRQLAKAYIITGDTERALNTLITYQKLSQNTKETQKLTISAYSNAGEIDKAITIANKMLKEDPQNPSILSMNGSLYVASGDKHQARTFFNKALQLQDRHPAATTGLANIEKEEGNMDKAITLYKGLVESDPSRTGPMLALSKLAAQQNRTNDMLFWLEEARKAQTTETKSRIILTKYYLSRGQSKKAGIYIKEAIKISPESTELLALHGEVLIRQKRYSEALPPLKKLVTKLPTSPDAQVLLSEAFLRQGMLKNADIYLQRTLTLDENHAQALSLMAKKELLAGNYNNGLIYAKRLQQAQPQLYKGYMQEGDAWLAKKSSENAQSAFAKAWKVKKTALLAKKMYLASRHSAEFNDAVQPLLIWLENNPGDNTTRTFLATIYMNEKHNEDAIREYEVILKEEPDNENVLNNLAWLYSLKGDPKALDLAERAYRAAPKNAGVLDTYGWILVQQGQATKGLKLIKQAQVRLPNLLEIRYHYAVALIKSGDTDEGQQVLEKLIQQDKPFNGRGEAEQLLGKQQTSIDHK